MSELTEERVREIVREELRAARREPLLVEAEVDIQMAQKEDREHPLFDRWMGERRELSTNMNFRDWLWGQDNDWLVPSST